MSGDNLFAIGKAAKPELSPDDFQDVWSGKTPEIRKAALMRLLAGAYKRGWDEAEQTFAEAITLASPPVGPVS